MGCALHPDGATFVAYETGYVTKLDVATGQEMWKVQLQQAQTLACAFSPCGERAAFAQYDNYFTVIDYETGKMVLQVDVGAYQCAVSFFPDNKFIAVATDDSSGNVLKVDAKTGTSVWTSEYLGADPMTIHLSPCGSYIFVSDEADNMFKLDASNGEMLLKVKRNYSIFTCAMHPDGTTLAWRRRTGGDCLRCE
jgi:DNA-binding beta-propeller fold protein YncE